MTAVEIQKGHVKSFFKQVHRAFLCWPENGFLSEQNFASVDDNVYSCPSEIEKERPQTGSALHISDWLICDYGRQLQSHSQDNYSAPSRVLDNTLVINLGLENKL